jgi:hypothetical protein
MLIDLKAYMGYILKFPISNYPIHFTEMEEKHEKCHCNGRTFNVVELYRPFVKLLQPSSGWYNDLMVASSRLL